MNPTDTNAYFAGGMYETGNPTDPIKFRMVHATGDDRPYLTKHITGLQTTSEHASLYLLNPDRKTARLIDRRYDINEANPEKVTLTMTECSLIEKAIQDEYYFA